MKIDKAGEYRTSSGEMVDIYTIFAGAAYGYVVTECVTTWWRTEDGSHPTQAELRIVGKWDELPRAKPPQTAQRLEDLQLAVAQTLERLRQLQRYKSCKDRTGDFLKVEDVLLGVIEDLRRAMGDCTLDEKGQR